MPNEIDWVRLAAYIETEGSIFIRIISSKRPWHELRVSVVNTDPRLPQWCKDAFSVGSIGYRNKHRNGQRPTFEWTVSGPTACLLLEGCLAYFVIKRDQAALGIAFQKTKTRAYGKGGVPVRIHEERNAMLRELRRLKHVPLESLRVI